MSKYLGLSLTVLVCLAGRCFGIGGDMGAGTDPCSDGSQTHPWLIEDFADFEVFADDPNYWGAGIHTRLECDLDLDPNLSGRCTYTQAVIASSGIVEPAGQSFQGVPFRGVFDGAGHAIRNLTIVNLADQLTFIGLFGFVQGSDAVLKNITMEGAFIEVGSNCWVVSILCGSNGAEMIVLDGISGDGGMVHDCRVDGSIHIGNSCRFIGGLCGVTVGPDARLSSCRSKCVVMVGNDALFVGGLCGENTDGVVLNSYAIGSISGEGDALFFGGLCGTNGGTIGSCYANTYVSIGENGRRTGGLCGLSIGTIANCYATGAVIGGNDASDLGGLCGFNYGPYSSYGVIDCCYSTGAVSGGDGSLMLGGLCGDCVGGSITNSFWDVQTSGITTSDGGLGTYTSVLQKANTFVWMGWDFNETWWINEARDYPRLFWQPFGDVDHDSRVDLNDLAVMSAAWGSELGDGNYNSVCELSGDDAIDTADLMVLADWWLAGPAW